MKMECLEDRVVYSGKHQEEKIRGKKRKVVLALN
jgi:hypothetical protein